MRVLTIKQPWARLIVIGEKLVENRGWATSYRGPLVIHAGKSWDQAGAFYLREHMGVHVPSKADHVFGALVGMVEQVGCVSKHPSPFAFGPNIHVYEDPREFPKPIPAKGSLGFWHVPDELVRRALRGEWV